MYFNPLYFVFALPGLLLGLWAQSRVKSNFNKYSQVGTTRGLTGAQVARQLLDAQGLYEVGVEPTNGFLSDHYDPRSRILRLSPDVYNGRSVAAAGIAAHEMGHALQHAQKYLPLQARSAIVPAVQFSSMLAPWIFMAGLFLGITGLAWVGVIAFSISALFALVTLPVEFDASKRAKALLTNQGFVYGEEARGVNKVLDAAALTYVAAAVSSVMQLLYFVSILNGRD